MRIINCKTNHLTSPLGYQMDAPVFSWQVEDARGKKQESARIRIWKCAAPKQDSSGGLASEGTADWKECAPVSGGTADWKECVPASGGTAGRKEDGSGGITDQMECCFDSGEPGGIDSLGYRAEMELEPRTRYYWTVKVTTDAGEEEESPVNWFETGKREEPWEAQWITCRAGERHPIFQRQIRVGEGLVKARLYICGLGAYHAEIDGQPVSGEFLTPYCNNYNAWLQYQTYDVTELLRQAGTRQLSAALGNGWYLSRFGFFSRPGDPPYYGREMKLIAELRLFYEDGREEVIGTDESWSVRRSNVTFSGIYDGERRDDTLPETEEEPSFLAESPAASQKKEAIPLAEQSAHTEEEPAFLTEQSVSAKEAMPVPLVERYSIPVCVHEELRPRELIRTPAGELVLDLGQNLAGIFRLRVHVPAGTTVRLSFGEVLQGGNFYRDNLRTALAEYTYISDGTEREIRPEFTFYGYRYVKVEGIPDLKKEDFTALAVYSDLPMAGSIRTGHGKVNQLIQNALWGLKGNFLDVPTDCPQRDERMGWTGDAQVFSPTAGFFCDSYAFYRKYLHDMASEQESRDGGVPDVVPSFGYPTAASVWGDAACIIPWNLYLFYGDVKILEEQFDSMKAWVDYIRRTDGKDHRWRGVYHNGDWLALDHPCGGEDQCLGGTDEGYIADIYYANSAEIVARAAHRLGREKEARDYGVLAERLKQEILEEYFSLRGRCCINTQTGLLLALKFRLAPDRDLCARMLEKKLETTKGKLQTGFVGTPFLCGELTRAGMERQAYDLLLNEEYPGWLYEVNLGATTVWERWNSLNSDGTVSSTGMNSFNHYSYGSIVEWMFRDMAGLNPVEGVPGFRMAEIRPVPDLRIGSCACVYESAAGRYEVEWTAEDEWHLSLRIRVPFGCQALLTLPYAPREVRMEAELPGHTAGEISDDGKCRLQAGSYRTAYRTTRPLRRIYGCGDLVGEVLEKEALRQVLEQYMPGISGAPDFIRKMKVREAAMYDKMGYHAGERLEELEKELNRVVV